MKGIHEKVNTDVVWSCVMEISVHYGCQARKKVLGSLEVSVHTKKTLDAEPTHTTTATYCFLEAN